MPRPHVTEDYYKVLEVVQTASLELIQKSYKRLALKLHPDRNTKHGATEAFQLLGRAYDTLKDESSRTAYDLIYPSITRSHPYPQPTQTPRPHSASTPHPDALSEAAQITALEKSKLERAARWWTKKSVFDSYIFELERAIRQLQQEIKNLNSIAGAEAAEESQRNSWGAWFLSPIYKKNEVSEKEKERKDRARQERRIETDMKERRLRSKQDDLKKEQDRFRKAKEEADAAILVDDRKIQVIQARKHAREVREREERQRVERELFWKQQQEQWAKREWTEAQRKRQAAQQAAEQKRQSEQRAAEKKSERATRRAHISSCRHVGWWPKVQGYTACPKCSEMWTYLLKCPSCDMKACPKCQADIRRGLPRGAKRSNPPRPRTPSPDYGYDDWD